MTLYRATAEGRVKIPEDEEAEILAERAQNEINAPIEAADLKAKLKLIELDKQSVRSIREWIAVQSDAPDKLVELESLAIETRKNLK